MAQKFAFRPLNDWYIHQFFGENKACVDIETGSVFISCDGNNPPQGFRSLYGPKGHLGLDLYAPRWVRTYNVYPGTVIEKQTSPVRGLGIGVLHEPWPGVFYKSRHWHLIAMDVDMGEHLDLAAFIGYCDNTGASAGDHLHFEIGTCDAKGENYVPVNPLDVMYPTFALDAVGVITRIREQMATIADQLADYMRGRAE